MNFEKHTPETLKELLERAKTLHINEGLGRKRDEITKLLDQCLEKAADAHSFAWWGWDMGMQVIKYELDGAICQTNCPHNQYDLVNGIIIRVGSSDCETECKYHKGKDNNTVTCSYLRDNGEAEEM